MVKVKKLIALDIMDTLIYDPWQEALCAATGLSSKELARRRDINMWLYFEQGLITEDEYWDHFQQQGISIRPHVFHARRRAGYVWLPGMRELLKQLQTTPHRIVLATNYPVWAEELKREMLADVDLPLHASHELGVRKPSPSYFEHLRRTYDTDYEFMLLIDDSASNTEALALLGGTGITHTNASRTKAQLVTLGVL